MTKKRPISSVAMFGSAINHLSDSAPKAEVKSEASINKKRVSSGVVSAARDSALADLRDERDRLKAELENAKDVVSLDPSRIDPSPFPDRLEDSESETDFEILKESISNEGQQLAILVRPHPKHQDRFQVAYGHRRLRAIQELGLPSVMASIRELSDNELLTAQGIENSARRDLSFIERALFADHIRAQCDDKREEVSRAKNLLSCTDADVSAFKFILTETPEKIIKLIGPAPKIGKPRWRVLAKQFQENRDKKSYHRLFSDDKLKSMQDSNQRFNYVLEQMQSKHIEPTDIKKVEIDDHAVHIVNKGKSISLTSSDKQFGEWLGNKISVLYEEYKQNKSQ